MAIFPPGAERRQFGRRQTRMHALIVARGRPSIPCVVRDISIGGALLEAAHVSWLPSRFRLVIEPIQFEANCEIVRRTEDAAGVRFTEPVAIKALGLE